MEHVAFPSDSVLYGKYPCVDRDDEEGVEHPIGMESFIVGRPGSAVPLVIPVQLAVSWRDDLIEILDNQTMVEKDYLLVTAPKTGTHWMWEIMSMLVKGKAIYSQEPKHQSWCEFKSFSKIISTRQKMPRVLNTHLTLSQLPRNFRLNDTKTVACMRNPKDVLVSLYYHFRNAVPRDHNGEFIKFDDMFECLLHSKYVPFGRTLDHYADIWDNYRNDPNLLIVFYEDVKESPEEMILLVADHMGVSYTEQLISDIAAAVDIRSMKRGKYCSETNFRKKYGEDASLYRKGEIGDWRNHFSTEQNRQFDEIFDEWNRERAIPFRFEPSLTLEY